MTRTETELALGTTVAVRAARSDALRSQPGRDEQGAGCGAGVQTTCKSGAAVCWHPARSPPALGLPPGLCLQGPLCSCRQGPCHPDWALASWGNQSVFLSPPGVLSCCLPVAGRPCWGLIPALGAFAARRERPFP